MQNNVRELIVEKDAGSRELLPGLRGFYDDYLIGLAQIGTFPGAFAENVAKVISILGQAKEKGVSLVVFPELTLAGYASLDLFLREDFLLANREALQQVVANSKGIAAIIGFADWDGRSYLPNGNPKAFNAAAVVSDGKILDIVHKTHLPDYDIFYESRYFSPGEEIKVVDVDGIKVGVQICEDLWIKEPYERDVSKQQKLASAEILINLSASPFEIGKGKRREELLSRTATDTGLPIIYTNLYGCYDGYDGEIPFDAQSMVVRSDGVIQIRTEAFTESLTIFNALETGSYKAKELEPIEELYEALVLGIKEYFGRTKKALKNNLENAFIGLSGGIDSALVAALAVDALGADKVVGITMPSRFSSKETKSDAHILADNLGIKILEVAIGEMHDVATKELSQNTDFGDSPIGVADENLQARIRMMTLMYWANRKGGIVLNTGNKTELAMDHCTIYGDMVGGVSVIGDVDKDLVYELSIFINRKHAREVIPVTTIERVPSAELAPNQSDENAMGASPQALAPIVRAVVEEGLDFNSVKHRYGTSFSDEVLRNVFFKVRRSEWKRRQGSPALRVTSEAFGIGRRIPIWHEHVPSNETGVSKKY